MNTVWNGAGRRIEICDVGMRDGLQMEAQFVPTEDKIALVDALSAAGLAKIEVTSFTSPTAIPALRDAEVVMREIARRPGVTYTALVPNARGAERAIESRTDELNLVMSVSETHNLANLRMTRAQSFAALAQVVAIEFTMPIWTAIFAVAFLGEKMTPWKNLAIVFGLAGVLIIVRPGASEINHGQIIMVVSAVGFGASIAMVKSLTRTESTVTIIFWMLVIQSAIGLLPALYTWQTPSVQLWPWILVVAFCGTYSHYCMTQAMRFADATVVVPMDFLRVPLSATVGWLLYSEQLTLATMAGAALILTGNLLNLKRS